VQKLLAMAPAIGLGYRPASMSVSPPTGLPTEPPAPSGGAKASAHYRPDIDGLRALAVLPVIFFHAGFSCPGGYVGVDVFFVISGYLITQIIERDLRAGRFSVWTFYQRRIRRIFPALFVMLAASIVAAYFALLPHELEAFGQSIIAASAFASNILFYRSAGYFAVNSELVPMLHTWTLSLEEQFYLGWPWLLALLSLPAVSRWKLPVSLAVLLGTLLLSAHWVSSNANAAYYLLPSRAWELALGAVLSFPVIASRAARMPRWMASTVSLLGIAMLVLTVAVYSKHTPFPGFAALLPCLGTALVIAAGESGPALGSRLLSWRPLVLIGMMSYSLYLWHWPVLVLGRMLANRSLVPWERGALVVLIFALSWLSLRYIETPFRKVKVAPAQIRYWILGGMATSGVFLALGAVLFLTKGLPSRGPDVSAFSREERAFQLSPCLVQGATPPPVDGCLLGGPIADRTYAAVLWGDSHAAHLARMLDEVGRGTGVTLREMTKAGCPPLPGVRFLPISPDRVECPDFNDRALQSILDDPRVRVVILGARWDVYVRGNLLLTRDGARPTLATSRQTFADTLHGLLATLTRSGRRVVLVGQVPLPAPELVSCVTRARFQGADETHCEAGQPEDLARIEQQVNEVFAQVTASLGPAVSIVRPYEHLCGQGRCAMRGEKGLYYLDDTHLSLVGARRLAPTFAHAVTAALRQGGLPQPKQD
jgi:peptidoglycan/LPS O-acetylase OafA/YrhL